MALVQAQFQRLYFTMAQVVYFERTSIIISSFKSYAHLIMYLLYNESVIVGVILLSVG